MNKEGSMQINVIALSVTAALFWGAAILIVACANWIWPQTGVRTQIFLI
jgi:hypothetical protein